MRLPIFVAAVLLGTASAGASAVTTFTFANLKYNSTTHAFSGFLPTDGVACTGGDLCSSNVDHHVLNDDLTYVSGGITAKATGWYYGRQVAVVQDHENGYNAAHHIGAGLGVYHAWGDSSDDNVTSHETLMLSFDKLVRVTQIGLASDGHNVTNWIDNATFRLDGVNTLLPRNVGTISPAWLSPAHTFSFAFGGAHPDQFYLSSITVEAIPEPQTYALMLAGLGAMGFVARRRQRRD
ncbi:MAG TPA: PEP-CTERM sorting domain-containing protein [Albitalea sp.]|nr:PEP-CTERM sorting domain-containing protein [Albitalea sp.]